MSFQLSDDFVSFEFIRVKNGSDRKPIVQVLVGCITCLLAAGITFGYAALKSTLVEEQVYRDLCTKDELDRDVAICYLQDQR